MRLIDADVLKEKVLEWMPNDPCGIEEKEFPFETDIVASLMMESSFFATLEKETSVSAFFFASSSKFVA